MTNDVPKNDDNGFSPCIQALGFVFHKSVEKAVDIHLDNHCEAVIGAILHQIA
jgi:hypothetical protein